MGAGAFGAGSSPAGAYTPSASNATAATAPWALKIDPLTRDFIRDDDGFYIAVHPVEHKALMRLAVSLTTIRSAQDVGFRWREVEFSDEATMTRRFAEFIQEAWRDLLTAGDVRVLRVRARPTNAWGRGRFEIDWMNLRDPQDPNRTTSL